MSRVLASIALAGLMAASQVAPLLHLVLVPHTTCAAHGELVHGDAHASEGAPAGDDNAVTASVVTREDAHEHCLTLHAQRGAVVEEKTRLAESSPRLICISGRELPAFASVAVLELAPKASPPV